MKKATAKAIRAKSYPPGRPGARDSTDNSRKERISELRKKGQLEKVKPTLFFSKAEGNELIKKFAKSPAGSLAEYIESIILGSKSYPSGRPSGGPRADNFALWSYPSGAAGPGPGTDNFAFWVEGKGCLEGLIRAQEASYERERDAINERLQRFHTKTVKGHTYWYEGDGSSGHRYIGREDPSPGLEKEKELILEKLNAKVKELKACIHAPLGNHYIIALDRITFSKKDQEIIELRTLQELSAQGPRAPGRGG